MEVGEKVKALKQLRLREVLTLSPMVLLIFWIGIYPDVFLDFLRVSVSRLIEQVHSAGNAKIGFNLQTFWP